MLESLRSVLRFRPVEGDLVTRRLAGAACVADLRRIARRRLPRGVFDYIDGGAEDERTLAANSDAFARTTFRPRVLRNVAAVNPSTTLLGRPVPIPLVLAPTGFTRIADPDGELAVARAAVEAGVPYTLSTLSTRSIEEVARAGRGPKWFQVYAWRDRGLVKEMLDRAAGAGYEAIVLTVDTAVLGRRERDVRRGFTLPPKAGLDTLVDGALHPRWTWGRSPRRRQRQGRVSRRRRLRGRPCLPVRARRRGRARRRQGAVAARRGRPAHDGPRRCQLDRQARPRSRHPRPVSGRPLSRCARSTPPIASDLKHKGRG